MQLIPDLRRSSLLLVAWHRYTHVMVDPNIYFVAAIVRSVKPPVGIVGIESQHLDLGGGAVKPPIWTWTVGFPV